MNRYALDKRLKELGIYSKFYYRKELKVLVQLLSDKEQLNCILTGVHEGNRKMMAVTDERILIIFSGALTAGNITVIKKSAVKEYSFEKKLLFSKMTLRTVGGDGYVFTNTQGSLEKLFRWAMEQPLSAAE